MNVGYRTETDYVALSKNLYQGNVLNLPAGAAARRKKYIRAWILGSA